ncbi:MAG: hypothetical protein ACYSUX_14380 [Planctomycetota bacterium]|jgi:hypothetical protein
MKNSLVLLLGLICLFAGCTKYYYQEGKSFNECVSDRSDCYAEMQKRLAVQTQRPSGYAHKFMEECMKSKGYELVTEGKLPLDAKRQEPDTTLQGYLYGHRRGIAGALDGE